VGPGNMDLVLGIVLAESELQELYFYPVILV